MMNISTSIWHHAVEICVLPPYSRWKSLYTCAFPFLEKSYLKEYPDKIWYHAFSLERFYFDKHINIHIFQGKTL
jgi:hypothetical protein